MYIKSELKNFTKVQLLFRRVLFVIIVRTLFVLVFVAFAGVLISFGDINIIIWCGIIALTGLAFLIDLRDSIDKIEFELDSR